MSLHLAFENIYPCEREVTELIVSGGLSAGGRYEVGSYLWYSMGHSDTSHIVC